MADMDTLVLVASDMDTLIWIVAHNDYPHKDKIDKHLATISPKITSKGFFLLNVNYL